ncbi:MAG TPA: hypothetical protein VH186_28840 [Chloroflexia bacterium]|nr:hypothetical protein [Chloroflexia bacterium]
MGFFGLGKKEKEPDRTDLVKLEDERRLLSNLQRGTQIGDFVVVCRTDYVQAFSDPWVAQFEYRWVEYLLLTKRLLQNENDLSALVFLPQDLSEVYYVVVPPQSPNHTHLTPRGRAEYELYPGYEAQVDAALYKDYSVIPKRSVYHSVDPQGSSWDHVVDDVLSGRKQSVVVEYNGTQYTYNMPRDKKEAESSFFTAMATRRGAYPMEESLMHDRRFDIVPSLPDGVTGRITVREFAAEPKPLAPFSRISFQRTEIPPNTVPEGFPTVHANVSFGADLGENESLIRYLETKYVQLDVQNPVVKIAGYY